MTPRKSKKKQVSVFELRVLGFFDLIVSERYFLGLISVLFFLAGLFSPYPHIAMWFGFAVAGYSSIANDSIQTIGTFIVSNKDKKWWLLWLYIGGIFLITIFYSWYTNNGDVSYQRLMSKGFEVAPTEFTFLQLAAPVFLIVLTRLRMPVSTTFLLLNIFSSSGGAIIGVISKSFSGYVIAFLCSIFFFSIITYFSKKIFKNKAHSNWTLIQWITSGLLWSVWIMQDAANIAIFLPRSLSLFQFLVFAVFIFLGLGILFFLKGDRIQKIVDEKTEITDVRAATFVDFVYAIILIYFKEINNVPMSTTWVFLGLLGGRELVINFMNRKLKNYTVKKATLTISKDFGFALIGLLVSLILAVLINPEIKKELLDFLF